MDVQKEYNNIDLKKCNCICGERYYDQYRKMYIMITPEETVRQKTTSILEKMGFPRDHIWIEEPVSHYGVDSFVGRMDIVVTDDEDYPLLVVECKAPSVPVYSQQVADQAEKYSMAVQSKYYVVVNGIDCFAYAFDDVASCYVQLKGIPRYEDMVSNQYIVDDESDTFERLPYADYYDKEKLQENEWYSQKIGEDTPDVLIPVITNLDDCLLYDKVILKRLSSKLFDLIEDVGVQYRVYGDASGGDFGSGEYRVLRLLDNKTSKQFLIGFSIMATGKFVNDLRYGTSDGKSVLCVIKNDGNSDDLVLQINLNKCLSVNETLATLMHNALVTRKGKTKSGLLEYVAQRNKSLVDKETIYLGEIDVSTYLDINSDLMRNLFSNLIEYAIYRDEYKRSPYNDKLIKQMSIPKGKNMKILFCNIAWMVNYRGITEDDKPIGGGQYVFDNNDAHEKYNFEIERLSFDDGLKEDGDYCLGFVETKSTNKEDSNQMHIEKIDGCELCTNDDSIDDVLVVYCANNPSQGFTSVVGWYNHATVYRHYMSVDFDMDDGETNTQFYNAIAKGEDCVLLPKSERAKITKWKVPRKNKGMSYGFGRANIWFAQGQNDNDGLKKYITDLKARIDSYTGENLVK